MAVNWAGQPIYRGDTVVYVAVEGSATEHRIGVVELLRETGTARVRWVARLRTGRYGFENFRPSVGHPRTQRLYRIPDRTLSPEIQRLLAATRDQIDRSEAA